MTAVTSVTMRRNVIMRGRCPSARVARGGGGALEGTVVDIEGDERPRAPTARVGGQDGSQPPSIFRSFSLLVTPTCCAASSPFLKMMTVGTLMTPNRLAVLGASSVSTLQTVYLPTVSSASFSTMGARARH